ncbi:MAG: MFS transporter, partial [Paracoccus sp. (in: a-proteobacteria)]
IWYAVFMVPFLWWVREPVQTGKVFSLRIALTELGRLISGLRHRPSMATWLVSSMLSRDALNALYGFGGVYAGTVLGWPVILSGIFGIVSVVSAAGIAWLGGRADRLWGPKPVIIAATLALLMVCIVIVSMARNAIFGIPLAKESSVPDVVFFLCGALIGGAGGAMQAASRSLTVRHTSATRATEAFGLYALSGKATAFLAPFLIARMTDLTGSQRIGVSPLIVMFLLAIFLLQWVNKNGETEQ